MKKASLWSKYQFRKFLGATYFIQFIYLFYPIKN